MIKHLKRNQLDIKKYDACIKNSLQSRIYAFSWYLDIVADNWDALIFDDYKAVMPLPWRKKYLIKYIYNPSWTQQLGVFSTEKVTKNLIRDFLKSIPNKFKKTTIQFNAGNVLNNADFTKKVNYIVPLNEPYNNLKSKFSKGRKFKNNFDFTISNDNYIDELILLFKNTVGTTAQLKEKEYLKLSKLITYLKSIDKVIIYSAHNSMKNLCAGAFFIQDDKRITYLFSASNQEGRDKEMMAAIINNVIKKYENTNYILDFEGSMIPGVAKFCKSFGALEEYYYLYQKSQIIL